MKKLCFFLLALVFAGSVFAAGKKPKNKVSASELVEYQGSETGIALPKWFQYVAAGDKEGVAKELKISGKMIFMCARNGKNLDFLRTWTDLVDARSEVVNQIETSIANTVASSMVGKDDETVKKTVVAFTSQATNLTLNGLEKAATFWTQTRKPKQGLKKAKKPEDWEYQYNYYIVFTMDQKLYDTQITAAIKGVDDNTSETEELKKLMTERLKTMVLPTGDMEDAMLAE